MNSLLETVCEFIEQGKMLYPDAKLYRNGDIQYCNGNDTTDFDWHVNDRLCEFGCGTEDNSVWAFKCLIDRDGLATLYCYPNGEAKPVETIEEQLFTEEEVETLFHHMVCNYDDNLNWDCFLVDIEE